MTQITPETRAKIRETARRRWSDPEYQARVRGAHHAVVTSPEHRAKVSEAMREWWASRKGTITRSPEARAKIGASTRSRWADPEWRARFHPGSSSQSAHQAGGSSVRSERRSRTMLAHWQDPAYRAKVSAGHVKRWQDPEWRARVIESQRKAALKRWQDPAYRAHMAEAQRAAARRRREGVA